MKKRVLVTGGAGFIASTVIATILERTDWEIVSLDRLDFSGSLNRLEDTLKDFPVSEKKRIEIVFHDLKAELNPQARSLLGDVNLILHLAAGSHVDRSIEFPMDFVMDNVIGTVNLLQYARTLNNLERFLYFSTDEVMGPAPKGLNYPEICRYNATNPYSASKASAEQLCVAFENTYRLPVAITRTMNVFGERQNPEKYIPSTIRNVRDGGEVTIHSDPTRTIAGSRFYIHAKDVAEALMFILGMNELPLPFDIAGAKVPIYHIVGKEEVDNLKLALLIAECQGKPLNYTMVDFHSSRPGHDLRYALSGDFLKSLGWVPKIAFSERIKEVVDWSLAHPKWL